MRKIIYYKHIEQNKSSKLSFISLALFVILILFFGYSVLQRNKSNNEGFPLISPVAKIINETVSFINSRQNSKALESIIQNILKNDKNYYGIVIDNLKTGERYYFNEDKIFNSASLYKLWVMAVVYQKIENGRISKTNILSENVVDLNEKFNISTESAELTQGTITWPVQNALQLMITISDNYSALLLAEKIGLVSISDFLKKYGLSESKVGNLYKDPVTSAQDAANFIRQLYDGQLASSENTLEMIDLLKNQQINTKLSKNLPKNTVIAHKTGELNGFSHDAGIVYSQKGDYIIVILSKTDHPLETNENIAEISREVYDYFIQ